MKDGFFQEQGLEFGPCLLGAQGICHKEKFPGWLNVVCLAVCPHPENLVAEAADLPHRDNEAEDAGN
jgi:hypothetical protein